MRVERGKYLEQQTPDRQVESKHSSEPGVTKNGREAVEGLRCTSQRLPIPN